MCGGYLQDTTVHTKHEITLAVNCVTCVYLLSVMQLLAWLVAILLPVFQKSAGVCRCLVTQVNVNRLSRQDIKCEVSCLVGYFVLAYSF